MDVWPPTCKKWVLVETIDITMLNFFKPSDPAGATPAEAATREGPSSTTDERRFLPRPLPTPDVVEGNTDADWALWEATTLELLELKCLPDPVAQEQTKKPSP